MLGVGKNTVTATIKDKASEVVPVNPHIGSRTLAVEIVEMRQLIDLAINVQADEQWSYVGSKANQRWLWYAIDVTTGVIVSFVLRPQKDVIFEKLYNNLKRFNIKTYYTDDWGSYTKFPPLNSTLLVSKTHRRLKIKI